MNFDFIQNLGKYSRMHEAAFLGALAETKTLYTPLLLTSLYRLKKGVRKARPYLNASSPHKRSPKVSALIDEYIDSVANFLLRLNYTHNLFTNYFNLLVGDSFTKDHYQAKSFKELLDDPVIHDALDTTEQEAFKRFNQMRNIFTHTPSIEVIADFTEEDFSNLKKIVDVLKDVEQYFSLKIDFETNTSELIVSANAHTKHTQPT